MSKLRTITRRVLGYMRDPWTVSRGLTLAVLAAGLTWLLTAIASPRWPLDLVLDWFPGLLVRLAEGLDIGAQNALILYGVLLTLVGITVFAVAERRARLASGRLAQMHERVLNAFLVTISFVVGFVGARIVGAFSGITNPGQSGGSVGFVPVRELWISGYHIHHFFYGFVLLVLAGWLALFHPKVPRRFVAILYGLGLGIFVDEWGLLVTLGDYSAQSSLFAGVTFLSLLIAGLIWTYGQARDPEEPAEPDESAESGGEPEPGA